MTTITTQLAAALQNLAETVAEICPTLDADVQSEAREVLAAYDAQQAMNTPNNAAAAMDRLEQKWREEAAAEWTHCQNKELSEWVRDRCYGQHNRLLSCADELAALRATLAQPDALASQPSGEVLGYVSQSSVDALDKCRRDDHNGTVDLWMRPTEFATIPVYTHPPADAPVVAVDEAMATRAIFARNEYLNRHPGEALGAMHAALTVALAPKPEGGHG